MTDIEKTSADATNNQRPIYDETEVNEQNLQDANSTRADVDRGAFNPRGRIKDMGKGAVGAVALGAAFVGFVVYSMASQPTEAPTRDDSTYSLDDASAERSARQAASVVVQPDKMVGTDPFGNPIMGQDLSGAPVVPAVDAGDQSQRNEQIAERLEQQRQAAIQRERARQDAMRRAPVMAVSPSSGMLGGGNVNPNTGPFSNLRVGGGGNESDEAAMGEDSGPLPNQLQHRMNGMDIDRVSAGRLGNRNFLLTAGMQVPCVLQTAMDSTQPGLTSCLIPQDIWSNNGQVILMEKGTRVLGEYQGGFSTGEQRIFVLWNRAVTPSGVSVNLASPAADQLGRAGMGGKIENFFWQRFGGALLLSIVGDVGNAVSDNVSGVDQTTRAPNSAAAVAAQDSQRIRPRLRAPQGREMTIMVARDVDFSSVYSLRLRR